MQGSDEGPAAAWSSGSDVPAGWSSGFGVTQRCKQAMCRSINGIAIGGLLLQQKGHLGRSMQAAVTEWKSMQDRCKDWFRQEGEGLKMDPSRGALEARPLDPSRASEPFQREAVCVCQVIGSLHVTRPPFLLSLALSMSLPPPPRPTCSL